MDLFLIVLFLVGAFLTSALHFFLLVWMVIIAIVQKRKEMKDQQTCTEQQLVSMQSMASAYQSNGWTVRELFNQNGHPNGFLGVYETAGQPAIILIQH